MRYLSPIYEGAICDIAEYLMKSFAQFEREELDSVS